MNVIRKPFENEKSSGPDPHEESRGISKVGTKF